VVKQDAEERLEQGAGPLARNAFCACAFVLIDWGIH
jgi:hypothetical protein